MSAKYEVDGTDLLIRNLEKDDEGRYLCKAVQNVINEEGVIKYSDFKDYVIELKIERKFSDISLVLLDTSNTNVVNHFHFANI